MQYTNKAYLLTGGNQGNRLLYLQQALDLLNEHGGRIVNQSPVYETAAWGNEQQGAFLNQALELETASTAGELMTKLLWIEAQLGRTRLEKYGPRIIDIDILFFNKEIHAEPGLIIPHGELQNRRFVLQPLTDIAADFIHPLLKKSVSQLLQECPDDLPVRKFRI